MLTVILGAALLIYLAAGYFDRSTGDAANNTTGKINLAEVNRFEAGAFENPRNCAGCHPDIYAAWSQSMHRFGWVNAFISLTTGRPVKRQKALPISSAENAIPRPAFEPNNCRHRMEA